MRHYSVRELSQRRKLQAITAANGPGRADGRTDGRRGRASPASSGGTRSRPLLDPVVGRIGEETTARPQPGRIDCPFVGLGDKSPQIYNPIILADGDGRTTQGKIPAAAAAVAVATLSKDASTTYRCGCRS